MRVAILDCADVIEPQEGYNEAAITADKCHSASVGTTSKNTGHRAAALGVLINRILTRSHLPAGRIHQRFAGRRARGDSTRTCSREHDEFATAGLPRSGRIVPASSTKLSKCTARCCVGIPRINPNAYHLLGLYGGTSQSP